MPCGTEAAVFSNIKMDKNKGFQMSSKHNYLVLCIQLNGSSPVARRIFFLFGSVDQIERGPVWIRTLGADIFVAVFEFVSLN